MDDQTIDRIVERFRQQLVQKAREQTPIVTIDQIEAVALDLRGQAGQVVAEELAASSKQPMEEGAAETKAFRSVPSNKTPCNKTPCCGCGGTARYKGMRGWTIVTMVGPLRLLRRYFYCRRCDKGFCPADARFQFGQDAYTRRVQQETTRLCALAPYAVAVEVLEQLSGVQVCVSHAQRMVACAGEVAASVLAHRLQVAEQADQQSLALWAATLDGDTQTVVRPSASLSHLYVEMDGVQTPLLDGWNEMKIGVCFGVSLAGKVGSKRYVSHLGTASQFAPHLRALAIEGGLDRAQNVVVLGDGSAWIWNIADQQFPGAVQILDFWHVMDRLAKVGRCAFGEDTNAVRAWLAARAQELRQSDLESVRQALRTLSAGAPSSREAVTEELGYLKNNASRMDYQTYLADGLLIGSGAVESGCKRVVTQRLKGAGMRWVHAGAQTMARLRCLVLNGQWSTLATHWNTPPTQKMAWAV